MDTIKVYNCEPMKHYYYLLIYSFIQFLFSIYNTLLFFFLLLTLKLDFLVAKQVKYKLVLLTLELSDSIRWMQNQVLPAFPVRHGVVSVPIKSLFFIISFSQQCGDRNYCRVNCQKSESLPILVDTYNEPTLVLQQEPIAIEEEKDLNTLICSFFQDQQTEKLAYSCYQKAKQQQTFTPNERTLNHLVRYSIRTNSVELIVSICEDFSTYNVFPGRSSCSRLISFCVRSRKFKLVNNYLLHAFKNMKDGEIAVSAFDSAMKEYNKLHMYSSTIIVFNLMKSSEIVFDPGCYSRAMEAYMKTDDYEKVISLFHEVESKGVINSTNTVFKKMYRILCQSLGKLGRPFEALEYFKDMPNKGIINPYDHFIYSSLICGFADIRELKVANELLKEAESKNMLKDPGLFLKLVLVFIEEGLLEKTIEIIYVMKNVKVRVTDCIICAIVNGYSKKRGPKAAIKVYEDLKIQGCEPGQVTYASVINVYYRLGLFLEAEKVFLEMQKLGYHNCVVAYSNMVAMYGKRGRVRDATKLLAKMKERGCEPNVWVYNAFLDMHGRALNLRQVEKTWKEMKRRKIAPDKVSYTSVISAYNKAREFESCVKYYYEYRLNGGVIDRAMAGIMVGVFSKMNKVDELVKLLQDLKNEETILDARLYRSALSALTDIGLLVQAKSFQQSFGSIHENDVYYRKR